MSDLTNITNSTIDKLIVTVGEDDYGVTGLTLRLLLNRPATCEVVLAQGTSVRRGRRSGSTTSRLNSSALTAFTAVVVKLYANGDKDPIILFRGTVTSVSNIATKNPAGSFAGAVLNCAAPPMLMGSYGINDYRYWGSKSDSKGKSYTKSYHDQSQILNTIGTGQFLTTYTTKGITLSAANDFADYMVTVMSLMLKVLSDDRYPETAVSNHFDTRGRVITTSAGLADIALDTDATLSAYIGNKLKTSNPFTALQAVLNGQMFLSLAPLMCGKMDIVPNFPWIGEPLGLISRRDILKVRDVTAMSALNENVDSVMVPVLYDALGLDNYIEWPEESTLPAAGVSRVVNIPEWLSPFANNWPGFTKQATAQKTDKAAKVTKEETDDKAGNYRTVAKILAQAMFAEVKNSGVTLEVDVPWYRLEFLDALGYLIEIEQPLIDTEKNKENLFGYLVGAAVKIQSTPGGSSAQTVLSFTHVRGAATQEEYALESNPMYTVNGGPEEDIKAFLSKPGRMYNRATQIKLEGGAYDDYLAKAIEDASNKK